MDCDLEQWLTRFAAGAGVAYPWKLTGRGWLRTRGVPASNSCPLLAQLGYETGAILGRHAVWEAGERQGLLPFAVSAILRAADRNPTGYDATLRAHLLAICHVEETVR